jgi:CRP/FNR family cyclic AMP-dependent transcriptional regulator
VSDDAPVREASKKPLAAATPAADDDELDLGGLENLEIREEGGGPVATSAAQPPPAPAASPPPPAVPFSGDALELLAKVHMFEGLQPAYLKRIAAIGAHERHEAGTTIFAEGAVGDKMYLIASGAVRISREVPGMGEEALAVLRPGNYFGEMALIDDSPRSADAKAHETTEVFVIRKEDLEDLLFVDRDLAYDLLWNFVRTLSGRLRETNDKMTFLAVTNRF